MLKPYLPGTNTLIFSKRHYKIIPSGKLVNELHDWIWNHPHVINSPNVSESLFVKNQRYYCKETEVSTSNISTRSSQWYYITNFQRIFFGAINVDSKVCIGDTSLRKYIPEYIQPTINRKNITCACKTCIRTTLLQSDINTSRLSQLAKLYKLYNNYE